jgi:hypothetical protein
MQKIITLGPKLWLIDLPYPQNGIMSSRRVPRSVNADPGMRVLICTNVASYKSWLAWMVGVSQPWSHGLMVSFP